MASIVVAGDTSGTVTLTAPAVSGTTTLTLPTANGTLVTTASGQTLTSPTIATPTITGQATIPTINLTGGQITFPATAVPSANANTLDDYEEGTWTPTYSTDGTAPSLTYADRAGFYIKIGRMVFISFKLEAATVSSQGTGNMNLTGLPFTASPSSVSGFSAISVGYSAGWSTSQSPIGALIFSGNTFIRPYYMTSISANKSDCTFQGLGSSMVVYMAGCYYTDS